MLVLYRDLELEIEERLITYSPWFKAMLEHKDTFPVKRNEKDAIILDDSIPLNPRALKEYFRFLRGEGFKFVNGIKKVFRFMCHKFDEKDTTALWKAQLQDQWIRDHFESLE